MSHSGSLRKGLKVLVVDHDLDSCEMLAALFSLYEIQTTVANRASEAIAIMQQVQPDLLISEILLPDQNGYWLMEQVKEIETAHGVRIPAITLTIYSEESDRRRTLTAGFCRHLSKPCDLNELIATIASITKGTEVTPADTHL